MFGIAHDVEVPPFTADKVVVRVDAGVRAVFVIPDEVARVLRRAATAGWQEVPGCACSEGDRYPVGSQVHAAATVLLEVARALPVGVDDMPARMRGQLMRDAAFGSLYAFVVGRSSFDHDRRQLLDQVGDRNFLHLPGSLHTWRPSGAVYWSG